MYDFTKWLLTDTIGSYKCESMSLLVYSKLPYYTSSSYFIEYDKTGKAQEFWISTSSKNGAAKFKNSQWSGLKHAVKNRISDSYIEFVAGLFFQNGLYLYRKGLYPVVRAIVKNDERCKVPDIEGFVLTLSKEFCQHVKNIKRRGVW